MQLEKTTIAILGQYLASSCVVNGLTAKRNTHTCVGPWHVAPVALIAGSSKQWRLLMAGD